MRVHRNRSEVQTQSGAKDIAVLSLGIFSPKKYQGVPGSVLPFCLRRPQAPPEPDLVSLTTDRVWTSDRFLWTRMVYAHHVEVIRAKTNRS